MSKQIILAYVLCLTLYGEAGAYTNPYLIEIKQANQQTEKERKEAEKRAKQQAKDEERQRKEEERRAKEQSGKRPSFSAVTDIPEGKALVYIYKPKTYGKEKFRIAVNGEPITVLKKGGYFPYFATPGAIVFTANAKARIGNVPAPLAIPKSALRLSVEPGKVYYIKEPGGFKLTVRLDLVEVPPETAEKEIRKCKLLPPYEP
jgi:hypothetical protein